MEEKKDVRVAGLDMIRIVACMLVVLVHVSAQWLGGDFLRESGQILAQCFNILAFSGVTLFVMLSGALLFRPEKKETIKQTLLHRSLRITLIYLLWKFLYILFDFVRGAGGEVSLAAVKDGIFIPFFRTHGYYHLWYLPMAAVLYLLVPVVKEGVKDKNSCRLYLGVFLVVTLFLPTVFLFEFPFKYLLMDFIEPFDFAIFGGYFGYMILGHYLLNWEEDRSKKQRIVLYVMAILIYAVSCVCGVKRSLSDGVFFAGFSSPLTITNAIVSSALFVSIREWKRKKEISGAEHSVAKITFLIYLIHPLVITLLGDLCGLSVSGNRTVDLVLVWVIVTALSAGIAEIVKFLCNRLKA